MCGSRKVPKVVHSVSQPVVEDVWRYPRPPALVPCERRVRIVLGGRTIADSRAALRVLETSHPPTIYVPPADWAPGVLRPARHRQTWCEWKGRASYVDLVAGDVVAKAAGWTYPEPVEAYAALRDHVAVYPGRMDACFLDDERVQSQEGDFYGGWITSDLVGPFKGPAGTLAW
jgi:uncharacterized protein (DUF427 family)